MLCFVDDGRARKADASAQVGHDDFNLSLDGTGLCLSDVFKAGQKRRLVDFSGNIYGQLYAGLLLPLYHLGGESVKC